METKIINTEKGYIWPLDKLCCKCEQNIHLENKEDILKVTNAKTREVLYFCTCKCGEPHRIHAEQIPSEILDAL